jgi:hypothetical protein
VTDAYLSGDLLSLMTDSMPHQPTSDLLSAEERAVLNVVERHTGKSEKMRMTA